MIYLAETKKYILANHQYMCVETKQNIQTQWNQSSIQLQYHCMSQMNLSKSTFVCINTVMCACVYVSVQPIQ